MRTARRVDEEQVSSLLLVVRWSRRVLFWERRESREDDEQPSQGLKLIPEAQTFDRIRAFTALVRSQAAVRETGEKCPSPKEATRAKRCGLCWIDERHRTLLCWLGACSAVEKARLVLRNCRISVVSRHSDKGKWRQI